MLIDFRSPGLIELPRPSTINCATHPTGDPHQGSLQLQDPAGGLSIARDVPRKIAFQDLSIARDVSRQIAFQEYGRVVML